MSLIGIDLGTSYSRVAVYHRGLIKVVQDELHGRTISSCVAFTPEERLIGKVAKQQMKKNPKNTIYGSKRLIGKSYQEVQELKSVEGLPFDLENCEGKPKIRVQYRGQTKQLYPEEISAMVLSRLKDIVSKKVKVSGAVITVPASFNIAQRKATCDAANIAGIEVLGLINETTAVALAYRLRDQKEFVARNALVLHVGVGTFDVSVIKIGEGALEVKASIGNSHLGGENFTLRLFDKFCQEYQVDVTSNPADACKLRIACEELKSGLGDSNQASVEVVIKKRRIELTVTRETFCEQTLQCLQQIYEAIKQVMREADIDKQQIDDVLVTGGSAGMPIITEMMEEFGFEGKVRAVDMDEDAAYGAAALAALISHKEEFCWKGFVIQDVLSQSVIINVSKEPIFQSGLSIPLGKDLCWRVKAGHFQVMIVNEECFMEEVALTTRRKAVGTIDVHATSDECLAEWKLLIDGNGLLSITTTSLKMLMDLKVGLSIGEIEQSSLEAEVYQTDDKERGEVMKTLYDLERETDRHLSKCEEIVQWCRETSDPSREEIEKKRRSLSDIRNIMTKTMKTDALTQTEDTTDQRQSKATAPTPFQEEEKEELWRKMSGTLLIQQKKLDEYEGASLRHKELEERNFKLVAGVQLLQKEKEELLRKLNGTPLVQQMKRDDHTAVSLREQQLEETKVKLMKEVKLLQEEREELSKKLNGMKLVPQDEYKGISLKQKELEARNGQLVAEVKELQEGKKELSRKVNDMTLTQQMKLDEFEVMTLNLKELEAKNVKLMDEVQLLQDDNGNLHRDADAAEQNIKKLEKAERDLKTTTSVRVKEDERRRKMVDDAKAKTEIQKLKRENKQLQEENEQLQNLQAEKRQLKRENKRLQEENEKLQNLQAQKQQLKKENEKLQKENEKLQTVQADQRQVTEENALLRKENKNLQIFKASAEKRQSDTKLKARWPGFGRRSRTPSQGEYMKERYEEWREQGPTSLSKLCDRYIESHYIFKSTYPESDISHTMSSDQKLVINWDAPSYATEYILRVCEKSRMEPWESRMDAGAKRNIKLVFDTKHSTDYEYLLWAEKGGVEAQSRIRDAICTHHPQGSRL